MQRLEVSGAVRPIYGSLGVKRLNLRLISLSAKGAYLKSERETCSVSTKFLQVFKSTRFVNKLSYTHAN